MVYDTGATNVSITPSFALRAKIIPDEQNMMTETVVGGTIQSAPGYASLIQVGKTRAANVPVGVSVGRDNAYGPGIDGLLGMTFLARFVVITSPGTLELKPVTLNSSGISTIRPNQGPIHLRRGHRRSNVCLWRRFVAYFNTTTDTDYIRRPLRTMDAVDGLVIRPLQRVVE